MSPCHAEMRERGESEIFRFAKRTTVTPLLVRILYLSLPLGGVGGQFSHSIKAKVVRFIGPPKSIPQLLGLGQQEPAQLTLLLLTQTLRIIRRRLAAIGCGGRYVAGSSCVSPHPLAVRPRKRLYKRELCFLPLYQPASSPLHCRPLRLLGPPQQPPPQSLQLTWASRSPGMIDNLFFSIFDSTSPTQFTFYAACSF